MRSSKKRTVFPSCVVRATLVKYSAPNRAGPAAKATDPACPTARARSASAPAAAPVASHPPRTSLRQEFIRILEGDAVRRRQRRAQRTQERLAAAGEIPAHQHRVVLVRRVVAVLHEHAAPVA